MPAEKQTRLQSTIRFPYYDLADALEVAGTIHGKAGDECSLDQLARFLNHKSVSSGAFRLRLAAANMFGIIQPEAGRVRLTSRATAALSQQPDESQRSLVQAFLDVPLFKRIYGQYQGRQLPPEEGLKSVMRTLGVVPTQVDRAHSTLERSAETAGFFSSGRGYLVAPLPGPSRSEGGLVTLRDVGEPHREATAAGVLVAQSGIHPALMGLLQLLPPSGGAWRRGKREWLAAFNAAIEAIYPEPDHEGA